MDVGAGAGPAGGPVDQTQAACPAGQAVAGQVTAVMLRRPSTLDGGASVGAARAVLADHHVHMVLLTSGDRLLGTLVRDDLSSDVPDHAPALTRSRLTGRTVSPLAASEPVRQRMVADGIRRLAVLGDGDRLLGLLCLKHHGRGFCTDADVQEGRAARAARPCA